MRPMPLVVLLTALAGAIAAQPAAAQYQWRDENGRMVFSDRPPPGTVPPGSVVRAPARPATPAADAARRGDASAASTGAVGEPSAPAGPAAGAASPLAERELEMRKRAAERAEKDKREAEQRAAADRQQRACEEARAALRTLESGMRVARVNAQGEREFLSDEERERRAGELKKDLQQGCRAG